MSRVSYRVGYTIVETLIFLAISSALLVSAMTIFNGQNRKTQFTQSIRELDSYLIDVLNDVDTGYYANNGSIQCNVTSGGPELQAVPTQQGTNQDCITIGKVVQFHPADATESDVWVYSVVGRRLFIDPATNKEKEVSKLEDAIPTAIAPTTSSLPGFPDVTEHTQIRSGTKVTDLYKFGSPGTKYGAFGLFSSLSNYSGSGLVSENQRTQLVAVPGTQIGSTGSKNLADRILLIKDADIVDTANDGVVICFSDGAEQEAAITIGVGGQQLSTQVFMTRGNLDTEGLC